MAAIAAAATAFSTLYLSRTSIILPRRHLRTVITFSLSSATTEFNIKFAPPKPKPQLQKTSPPDSASTDPIYIPWIFSDESGNVTLQTTPSERFLRAIANESTQKKKKKDVKNSVSKATAGIPTAEPKYSEVLQ